MSNRKPGALVRQSDQLTDRQAWVLFCVALGAVEDVSLFNLEFMCCGENVTSEMRELLALDRVDWEVAHGFAVPCLTTPGKPGAYRR